MKNGVTAMIDETDDARALVSFSTGEPFLKPLNSEHCYYPLASRTIHARDGDVAL
jgi:hypothetical protein